MRISKRRIPDKRQTYILPHDLLERFSVEHLHGRALVEQPGLYERR